MATSFQDTRLQPAGAVGDFAIGNLPEHQL